MISAFDKRRVKNILALTVLLHIGTDKECY